MKIKVLAVDDSAVQLSLVKKYFNGSEKIEVIGSASNGEEAIKLIEKTDFDILILDIVLPLIDGLGVLKYMSENNIKKNVIVLTSFNEEGIT